MIDYNNHKTNNQERKQAMRNVAQKSEKSISGAIKINEKEIVDHLSQLVRQSVADTINSFPDGYSAMMSVGARLRHISTTKWGTRQSCLQNIRNGCIIRYWHNFYNQSKRNVRKIPDTTCVLNKVAANSLFGKVGGRL